MPHISWSEVVSAAIAAGAGVAGTWIRMKAIRRSGESRSRSREQEALDKSWASYQSLRVHLDQRFAEIAAENRALKEEIAHLRKEVARLGGMEAENSDLKAFARELEGLLKEATAEVRRRAAGGAE